jgi:hypothetical protein
MLAKTTLAIALAIATASSALADRGSTNAVWSGRLDDTMPTMMRPQTASIPDQKRDALAAALREGLFAEEYDAILEAAQDDPKLREKIIEHILTSPK